MCVARRVSEEASQGLKRARGVRKSKSAEPGAVGAWLNELRSGRLVQPGRAGEAWWVGRRVGGWLVTPPHAAAVAAAAAVASSRAGTQAGITRGLLEMRWVRWSDGGTTSDINRAPGRRHCGA